MPFPPPSLDSFLFTAVNQELRHPVLDIFMPLISNSALIWGIGILLVGIACWRTRQVKALLFGLLVIAATAGVTDITCNGIKKEVGRVRPYNAQANTFFVEDGIWQQRAADFAQTKQRGTSFVSAHAAGSVAAICMARLLWPVLPRIIWLLPFLIGYSRLYLGKHYPLDVFCGWLLGGVIALIFWKILPHRIRIATRGCYKVKQ